MYIRVRDEGKTLLIGIMFPCRGELVYLLTVATHQYVSYSHCSIRCPETSDNESRINSSLVCIFRQKGANKIYIDVTPVLTLTYFVNIT